MRFLREMIGDSVAIARWFGGGELRTATLLATMSHDGSLVLMMSRVREAALRWHIPVVGSALRRLQTALYGVEISRNVRLGEGVVFVHTVGIVIGGDAQVGDRVVFLGGNTVGTLDWRGYPKIGNDVLVGAGARILGPVKIGDGAAIGANAVVLCDVPAGATAVGVPAVIRQKKAVPAPDGTGASANRAS